MTTEESLYIERMMLLLAKKQSATLTETEQLELNTWLEADQENATLAANIAKSDFTYQVLKNWRPEHAAASLERINQRIYQKPVRKLWRPISVAAAIGSILIGAGLFYAQYQSHTETSTIDQKKDILPGHNGATLTLANGSKIRITHAGMGNFVDQPGVKISKTSDGRLLYEIADSKSDKTEFNTLSTARGEQVQLRLPDGTVVFLNAASSLKYPTTFKGLKTRETVLSGEAYFQVAKDKLHPFIVNSADQQVEVLGTQFNVNAYGDEDINTTKTTLEEGSVKIRSGMMERNILPGEQAIIRKKSIQVTKGDLEEVLAWKNGYFRFRGEKIKSIMSKLSRWYNIDVMYVGNPTEETFTGTVSRDKNISQALKILENTNSVKFKIEGRRITVIQ
jgi:transmembrane sensor